MPSSSLSLPVRADASRLAGITRLLRRICLLLDQGRSQEAARLQQEELAAAVRDFRTSNPPDALPDDVLQAMFVREEQRMAEAAALAELLIPRLGGGFAVSAAVAPVRVPRPAAVAPAGAPAIADLLDAMLAAERRATATSYDNSHH